MWQFFIFIQYIRVFFYLSWIWVPKLGVPKSVYWSAPVCWNKYLKHVKRATVGPKSPIIFFKNTGTISEWKSHKLHRHISFKIYSCLLHVLYSSNHILIHLICRSDVNGLIKSFWIHTPWSLDSKNACIWFLNRCSYILLFVLKKRIFSKFYYLGFLKIQYLDQFYSTYLLMIDISGYQKQTC